MVTADGRPAGKRRLGVGNSADRIAAAAGKVWMERRHDREEVILRAAVVRNAVQTGLQVQCAVVAVAADAELIR